MSFLHYYVQKGFRLDYLTALSPVETLFLAASMEIETENGDGLV